MIRLRVWANVRPVGWFGHAASMKLAKALKLPVPKAWLLRVPEAAYVVERVPVACPATA